MNVHMKSATARALLKVLEISITELADEHHKASFEIRFQLEPIIVSRIKLLREAIEETGLHDEGLNRFKLPGE